MQMDSVKNLSLCITPGVIMTIRHTICQRKRIPLKEPMKDRTPYLFREKTQLFKIWQDIDIF